MCAEHKGAHPSHISQLGKSQSKGGRPHGPSVAKGAPTIKLVPGWLKNITELRGGQLLQYMDDPTAITAVWGFTVLLSKPFGVGGGEIRKKGFMGD